MNENWKHVLQDAGAVIENDTVMHFGNAEQERIAARDGHILCDLSHFGLIAAGGEETQGFLQGQFSNDVQQVSDEQSQLSSYNSPKGRAFTCFRLFMRDGTYYMRLPKELLEPVLKRLRMFVLRAKVSLDDASDRIVGIGFSGPEADARLQTVAGAIPDAIDAVTQADGLTIIRIPGPSPRFEIYGEPATVSALWQRLAQDATPVGASPWGWLDIQAGIPNIYSTTMEDFVPQMVNLQLVNGVSFTKGCYPGQEVVARMHYLGKLKKRMYRAHIADEAVPAPGTNLYETANEQSVGKVVDAQPSPDGGYDVLAVLQIGSTQKPVHLGSESGAMLTLGELPYAVTNEA